MLCTSLYSNIHTCNFCTRNLWNLTKSQTLSQILQCEWSILNKCDLYAETKAAAVVLKFLSQINCVYVCWPNTFFITSISAFSVTSVTTDSCLPSRLDAVRTTLGHVKHVRGMFILKTLLAGFQYTSLKRIIVSSNTIFF